jgi:hypothetical protein
MSIKKTRTNSKKSRVYNNSQGYRLIGGKRIFFRSSWEVNVALYLEALKNKKAIREWYYEPQTFWFENIKRGVRSYKPDFKVIRPEGNHYWIEVKGYMDAKSNTKIKRFDKYYPNENLHIIDKTWFIKNKNECPFLCEDWISEWTEGDPE